MKKNYFLKNDEKVKKNNLAAIKINISMGIRYMNETKKVDKSQITRSLFKLSYNTFKMKSVSQNDQEKEKILIETSRF